MLIIDNIDDDIKMVRINDYLPSSNDGLILFIICLINVAISAVCRYILKLSEMDFSEAIKLLRESLEDEDLAEQEAVAVKLLEKLT